MHNVAVYCITLFFTISMVYFCRVYNNWLMAIKVKKPLCNKVEKVARVASKDKKKNSIGKKTTRKERITNVKKQLKIK